jgi:hypothetical protein
MPKLVYRMTCNQDQDERLFQYASWVLEVKKTDDTFIVLSCPEFVSARHNNFLTVGAACVKWCRELASAKFPGQTPVVDELDSIKSQRASCVVPPCYSPVPEGQLGGGLGYPRCKEGRCPYLSGCGAPSMVAAEPESDEDDGLLVRLRQKLKDLAKKA